MIKVSFAAAAAGAQALAVGVWEGGTLCPAAQSLDNRTGGLVTQALKTMKSFKGEAEDHLMLFAPTGPVILVGLGEADDLDTPQIRRIGGALFAELAGSGFDHLTLALDLSEELAAELAYGMRLRAWKPAARYRSKPDEETVWHLTGITVVTPDVKASERRYQRLAPVALASSQARDWVVAPANELTPPAFAERLKGLESLGVQVDILDARKTGLKLLHAVGQASRHAPLLAVLRWSFGPKGQAPIAFVGKGITFDTGGIDIKDAEDMDEMKGDMGGAAAAAGAIAALAGRKARVNAVAVLAIAENMPSGNATRPGDVVKGYGGKTVEIVDTDAEGRLALADALAWTAEQIKPALMIDLATLTGAVEIALGRHKAGLFTADDALAQRLYDIGEAEDEPLWRLPLTDAYDDDIKSPVADLRNCTWARRSPDHINAARFLQHFVPDGTAWAHLDIAGVSEAEEDGPLAAEGPTAFGVRLLDHLASSHFQE